MNESCAMTRPAIIFAVSVFLLTSVTADDAKRPCHSVHFPTTNHHRPFTFGSEQELFGDLLEQSLQSVPEPLLVQAVLGAGPQVGLTADQQQSLAQKFTKTYSDISRDVQMSHLPTALPYCLSSRPVKDGHYFLYVPPKRTAKTETILFLHGFGGNFLFYLKILKDEFPDHMIVIPSWGATWANGNSRYIREVYHDIRQRFRIAISTAHLMSISGGGAISFEIYNSNHWWFSDLTVFASMPRNHAIRSFREDLKILMINGSKDSRFPISNVQRSFATLKNRVPGANLETIDSDHFFFISQIPEWRNIIRNSAGF